MKHIYVTSLFFLYVIGFISLLSCETKQKTNPFASPLEKKLNSIYDNDSISIKERLEITNDFLKEVFHSGEDILLYRALMLKTSLHSKNKQKDSAIYFSKKLYTTAKKNGDTLYMGKGLTKLGLYYKSINKLPIAFNYFTEAYKIQKYSGDTISAGKNLHSMADIQKSLGDYNGSKYTAVEGVQYLEGSSEIKSLAGLYQNISTAFRAQENYDNALNYNYKAIQLCKNEKALNKIGKINLLKLLNTKANILADKAEYKNAIRILDSLLTDSIVIKNRKEYARVLSNKGFIEWKQNETNHESETLLLNSLQLRKASNDIQGLIASNIHLTKYYSKTDKQKALAYAEAAFFNAKERNSMYASLEALRLLFDIKNDLKEPIANDLSLYYITIDKTLEAINTKNQELYAVTKFDNEKLLKEKAEGELQIEKEKNQKNTYFASALVILLGSLFLYFFLKQQKRIGMINERHSTEKALSKKIHDEVGNDIFYIMTQIQKNPAILKHTEGLKILDGLNDIYNKARDISKEFTSIDTGNAYRDELNALLNSYGSDHTKIITTELEAGFWKVVSDYKKKELYRVLQELLTNMKKHSKASFAAVTFAKKGNKIFVNYVDNGVGIETLKLNTGLKSVENRIDTIGGTITFDSKPKEGFNAKIIFTT